MCCPYVVTLENNILEVLDILTDDIHFSIINSYGITEEYDKYNNCILIRISNFDKMTIDEWKSIVIERKSLNKFNNVVSNKIKMEKFIKGEII